MQLVGILTAVIVLIGVIYGYSRKGTENYWQLLKKGIFIGLAIGIIIGIAGLVAGGLTAGLIGGVMGGLLAGIGGLSVMAFIVIVTIEFVAGVFVGDVLEKIL